MQEGKCLIQFATDFFKTGNHRAKDGGGEITINPPPVPSHSYENVLPLLQISFQMGLFYTVQWSRFIGHWEQERKRNNSKTL